MCHVLARAIGAVDHHGGAGGYHGKTETEHREIIYGLNGRNRELREFKISLCGRGWVDLEFKNGLLSPYWTGREFIDGFLGHDIAG